MGTTFSFALNIPQKCLGWIPTTFEMYHQTGRPILHLLHFLEDIDFCSNVIPDKEFSRSPSPCMYLILQSYHMYSASDIHFCHCIYLVSLASLRFGFSPSFPGLIYE